MCYIKEMKIIYNKIFKNLENVIFACYNKEIYWFNKMHNLALHK